MKRKAKFIADIAMFIAIGCVINLLSMPIVGGFGRVSLVYCYCYLCGMFLGPWAGFAAAFCGDMIAALIQMPVNGPWMPIISLSSGVMALITGFVFRYWKKGSFAAKFSTSVLSCFFICTLVITPLGELPLFYIFPYTFTKSIGAALNIESPFLMLALSKAIMQPIWVCLNSFIAIFVYRRVSKAFFKRSAGIVTKDVAPVLEDCIKMEELLPLSDKEL